MKWNSIKAAGMSDTLWLEQSPPSSLGRIYFYFYWKSTVKINFYFWLLMFTSSCNFCSVLAASVLHCSFRVKSSLLATGRFSALERPKDKTENKIEIYWSCLWNGWVLVVARNGNWIQSLTLRDDWIKGKYHACCLNLDHALQLEVIWKFDLIL